MTIFKYTTHQTAQKVLKGLSIRFTQPSELDDPFEFRPFIDFEGTAKEMQVTLDTAMTDRFGTLDKAIAQMYAQRNEPRMAAIWRRIEPKFHVLRKDRNLAAKFMYEMHRYQQDLLKEQTALVWKSIWEKFYGVFGQHFGILSLTSDPLQPVMWSRYADEHRGMVIEFDREHQWFSRAKSPSEDFNQLRRVTYVQNPAPRTWKQATGQDVLFTKSSEWAFQKEWRIVSPLKDGTKVTESIVLLAVPPAAITSIIFGVRTPQSEIQSACDTVGNNSALAHVRLKKVGMVPDGTLETIDL